MNIVDKPVTFVFWSFMFFVIVGIGLALIFANDTPEPLYVDCESHLDFYLVNDYFDEEGFVYADIDDLKRIVYVGGGVFIGAE